jgi:hypothetical protein
MRATESLPMPWRSARVRVVQCVEPSSGLVCSVSAQLRLLARFSRGILERTYIPHRILRSAASSDPNAAELQRRDAKRRGDGQRIYIDMLLANGPLRDGLTPEDAAATYSALSNPATYALLVGERGWTADHFEQWLGDSLICLLLPHGPGLE